MNYLMTAVTVTTVFNTSMKSFEHCIFVTIKVHSIFHKCDHKLGAHFTSKVIYKFHILAFCQFLSLVSFLSCVILHCLHRFYEQKNFW